MANLLESLYDKFLECTGVSTDTRSINGGELFFALTGPNFNGNKYATQAIEKGAKYAVVDDAEYVTHPETILVDNVLKTLQELANYHRKQFNGKLIALTGSNGKTTTKELLNRVLSKKFKTLATEGNLNNHIGVPLTLLRLDENIEIAIVEMGANHVGEIADLCELADPDYGLITNIGEAHTETFGGIEGVLKGKTELFTYLQKNSGTPFINVADHRLKAFDALPKAVNYPDKDLAFVNADPMIKFRLGGNEILTQMIGSYNYQNIATAVSLGRYFGISDTTISEAIATYVSGNQRSQVIEKGPVRIIMDGYNANPTSMQAALTSFMKLKGVRHVILGDMKETENSANRHIQFGNELRSMDLDMILLVGPEMKYAADQIPNSKWFNSSDEAKDHLTSHPIKEGNVLIKGSRSIRMERILEVIG